MLEDLKRGLHALAKLNRAAVEEGSAALGYPLHEEEGQQQQGAGGQGEGRPQQAPPQAPPQWQKCALSLSASCVLEAALRCQPPLTVRVQAS